MRPQMRHPLVRAMGKAIEMCHAAHLHEGEMSSNRFRIGRRAFAALAAGMAAGAWAASEKVTLAGTDFPPYTGAGLPRGGFLTEITREAFRRAGYALEMQWYPWARALRISMEGGVDGLLGVWRSPDREKWLDFSPPLAANQVGFFRRSDQPIAFRSFADLAGRRIGVVRGYVNPKAFDDAHLRTDEAVDDAANLRKLGAGRVDLIVIDRGVANYLLQTSVSALNGLVTWMDPAIEVLPLHMGLVREAPRHDQLAEAFSRGLKDMERDGSLQRVSTQAGA